LNILIRFLLSKGWSIQKKTLPFYHLTPPKYLAFERENFAYRIPIEEIVEDIQVKLAMVKVRA